MSGNLKTNSFGQKLDWLKATFQVTDGEIGAAVGASDALVCRWRKDERTLDRSKDEIALKNLAGFFAQRAEETDRIALLARALSLDMAEIAVKSAAYRRAFIVFLYDGQPVTAGDSPPPPPPTNYFFGMDGLLRLLAQWEQRMPPPPVEITVYLSLEHSRILREETAKELWETLWRMGGGHPVRLVFDNWENANEAAKTLRGLLPFMQTGRLRLHLIKSTQKFFYSNISFHAAGIGIVITTEPAGGLGGSVSLLVESPGYVGGMGGVFARFDRNTKPVEKHLAAPKEEAAYFVRLFEPGGDLKTVTDGANLLYMDADAYMRLLKQNGIAAGQRAYRLERFVRDKQQFEAYLETHRVTEIFSAASFDRMIAARALKTPDFSFHTGPVKVGREILSSLFAGMLDCLERHKNLSIFLNRGSLPCADSAYRLKGDRFVLLHSFAGGGAHAVYSDTWLLVYEYIREFEEALRDGDLVTTRDAVAAALRLRLESLEGKKLDD